MRLAGGLATLAATLLGATHLLAADLAALEATIRQASADRGVTLDERTRLMGEASALADEIAQLKEKSAPASRANRALEEAMKRFDRVAARLDDLDRKSAEQTRTVVALQRRFEEAAAAESARLTADALPTRVGEAARALEALDGMRRRVAELVAGDTGFRPALQVSLAPGDGRSEIQQKLALLEVERTRVMDRIKVLDEDKQVLAARVLLKRQFLTELQNASRTAGPDLALLRRESDEIAASLSDLSAQREALDKARLELGRTVEQLAQRRDECLVRLKGFESKEDPR